MGQVPPTKHVWKFLHKGGLSTNIRPKVQPNDRHCQVVEPHASCNSLAEACCVIVVQPRLHRSAKSQQAGTSNPSQLLLNLKDGYGIYEHVENVSLCACVRGDIPGAKEHVVLRLQ